MSTGMIEQMTEEQSKIYRDKTTHLIQELRELRQPKTREESFYSGALRRTFRRVRTGTSCRIRVRHGER